MARVLRHILCCGMGKGMRLEVTSMERWKTGRSLLTGVAIATLVGGYLTDWNRTHLFNPRWTAHAKFHDAQTILMGSLSGASALILLRRTGGDQPLQLKAAAWILALFWLSMAGSILFPNTAQADPDFADLIPCIAGIRIGPSNVSITMLMLVGAGYYLEQRRMSAI
jgi:hypothetical protein